MMHSSNLESRAPFFETLSEGARGVLARLGSRRSYSVGDVLISEGDHAQEVMVLQEGLVKVTGRLDGERLMDIRIAGDIVGEVAAVDLGPRSATVTACGDVVATVVPLGPLLADPEVSLALFRVLCCRVRRSDRLRLEFGGYPVLVRLARVLVELAVSYGRQERNAVRIDVNLSQDEFAALVGSTAHTVHKALAQLRKDKLITTGCRQTYVNDLARLRKIARLSMPVAQRHGHKSQ
ncbi:Crp/Fnr family transcriptional regulator [Streptomyces sp. NPDC021093]|uniref:Crp/Fnr family transcriptional regulator n=1 Tax=Streptomyces sp. NPDC021093 TaxID=3365112 RepID=UPI0037997980